MKRLIFIIFMLIIVSGCSFPPVYTLGDFLGTGVSDEAMKKHKDILIVQIQRLVDSELYTYDELMNEFDKTIVREEKK